MTQNKASQPETGTAPISTEVCTQKQSAEKTEKQITKENVDDSSSDVECPINFDRLTMGTLRKYQYRFKINMAVDEAKPLITRA